MYACFQRLPPILIIALLTLLAQPLQSGVAHFNHATPVGAHPSGAATTPVNAVPSRYVFQPVGGIGGVVSAVAVSDTLAYIGEGGAVTILDNRNPASPVRLSYFLLPSDPAYVVSNIQVAGTLVYVTADRTLYILDASDPAHPAVRSSIDLPGSLADLQVRDNLVYLAADLQGLQIVDVSNPSTPTLVGSLQIAPARGLQVVGTLAYVTAEGVDGAAGLQIVDVSDPTSPVLRGSYDARALYAVDVQVAGTLAYLTTDDSLQIVDVSDPASPALRGRYNTGYASQVQVVGTLVYAIRFPRTLNDLEIIDVSNPDNPVLRGSSPVGGLDIQVVEDLAYIAAVDKGLQILDVSNPAHPTLVGSIDTPARAYRVDVGGEHAYVAASYDGLAIIDVSNKARPVLRGNPDLDLENTYDVQVVDNLAYLVGVGGLRILDIGDPAHPVPLGSYPVSAHSVEVVGNREHLPADHAPVDPNYDSIEVVGNRAYIPSGSEFLILDVSNPANPVLIGSYSVPAGPEWIMNATVDDTGDLAFITLGGCMKGCYFSEVQIVDVSDPTSPALRGRFNSGSSVQVVVDNLAYLAGAGYLQILDIGDPAHPVPLGSYPVSARSVEVVGTLAYIATVEGTLPYMPTVDRLEILDVSDPALPTRRGISPVLAYDIYDIEVQGDLIFAAGGDNGLQILRVVELKNPVLLPFVSR